MSTEKIPSFPFLLDRVTAFLMPVFRSISPSAVAPPSSGINFSTLPNLSIMANLLLSTA